MKQFRLSRRTLLRGASGVALALPWLEIMGTERAEAQTAATPAKRFMAVYTPGGTVMDRWRPANATETAFTLSPILAPFEAMKSKLLIIDGLDMKSAVGEQHQAGIVALLTGTPQNAARGQYASGPSIDQVIASRISATKKRRSLQVAVRWATGKSHGLLHPINSLNFEDTGNFAPISPRLDPVQVWNDLFADGVSTTPATNDAAARLERRKSILDFLDRKYDTLAKRLGAADKVKLEEHLTRVREIEMSLTAVTNGGAACAVPTLVDTSDYNPKTGTNSSDDGSLKDTRTDAAIPKVGKLMTDMLVMAMACDITGVATLQWSDTEAKHTFPWLNLSEHHHFYQHDGGFRPAECAQINTWYSQQHAYLLDAMSKIDMGGHTLLDESVVFIGSELSTPASHAKVDMPLLLAGGGGGLRGGRYLRFNHQSHNDLLVSILNLFGDTRTTFGDARYCAGPIGRLT